MLKNILFNFDNAKIRFLKKFRELKSINRICICKHEKSIIRITFECNFPMIAYLS